MSERVLKVVHAVPTEVVSEQVSVQRVGEMAGATNLRANVWTLNEGSQLQARAPRAGGAVPGARAAWGSSQVDGATYRLGERDAIVVPAGVEHQLYERRLGAAHLRRRGRPRGRRRH